MLNKDSD